MHKPVLLSESIDGLDLKPGEIFLDGTLGSAGHSVRVAELLGSSITIVGLDRDKDAIGRSDGLLRKLDAKFFLVNSSFSHLDKVLDDLGISSVDAILFDLGISSDQLAAPRGFSFQRDEPLDMRMSGEGPTAAEILNTFSESALELILRGFGEEKYSRRIAAEIVGRREMKPFKTTFDLVDAVNTAKPKSYRDKINPATKTFQALRIAVNEELTTLEEGLAKAFQALNKSGRLAVISFHSLEDRVVKNFFRDRVEEGSAKFINSPRPGAGGARKPIVPRTEEVADNPRSRSAKLRIIEKI